MATEFLMRTLLNLDGAAEIWCAVVWKWTDTNSTHTHTTPTIAVKCHTLMGILPLWNSFWKLLFHPICDAKLHPITKLDCIPYRAAITAADEEEEKKVIVTISFPRSNRPLIYMHSIRSLDYFMNVHHNFFSCYSFDHSHMETNVKAYRTTWYWR